MKSKGSLSIILLLSILLSLISCKPPSPHSRVYYDYFDTVSYIYSYSDERESLFDKRCAKAHNVLMNYHRLFDIYNEYEGINNLRTVNLNAGIAPVKVAPELIDFLLYAKQMYTATRGEMNIAMGAVLRLWHDCRKLAAASPSSARIPTEEELQNAARHIDINNLIIDKEAGTVYLSDREMSLDVGALGKGYATDKAAEALIEMGASSYVLNIGGNIRAIGKKPDGSGWLTGITHPNKNSTESFIKKITIEDICCVTSGDYERYFTVNNVNYHHIIDKDTLMPAAYFSSVTVLHPSSAVADALSTALFAMSYEEGRILAAQMGAQVIWVTRGDFRVLE